MIKRKRGIGVEGLMQKQFSSLIKQYEAYNRLKAIWWSYDASGEKRSIITGALLKAKGLNSGKADYEFIKIKDSIAYYIYLEFKKPKTNNSRIGNQTENQKEFENLFKNTTNVSYYICYSVAEAISILQKNQFLEIK